MICLIGHWSNGEVSWGIPYVKLCSNDVGQNRVHSVKGVAKSCLAGLLKSERFSDVWESGKAFSEAL